MLECLPSTIRPILEPLSHEYANKAEEIRIRINRPLEVAYQGGFTFVTPLGHPTNDASMAFCPTKEDGLRLLDRIAKHSLYTMEEELRRGYITIGGGHRIGLAGRVVLENGNVRSIKNITGFNVRIAREVHGTAEQFAHFLRDSKTSLFYHTLIISPPQRGKTTFLRDLARHISSNKNTTQPNGQKKRHAFKVGIVDERSEIAACIEGIPSFDVGSRTDVLDGCPKAEGMMMMIRSLSPEIIIVDEIGRVEDTSAIMEAIHAGITVIASVHGRDLSDVQKRPSLAPLFGERVFGRFVILSSKGSVGQISEICKADGSPIYVSAMAKQLERS